MIDQNTAQLRDAIYRALENAYGTPLVPEHVGTQQAVEKRIDNAIDQLFSYFMKEEVLLNLDRITYEIEDDFFYLAEGDHKLMVESYDLSSDSFICTLIRKDLGEISGVQVPAILIDILTGVSAEPEFFVGKSYWVGE
jgi:hypothetical protein